MIIELFVIESTFVHKSDMLLNVLDLERKKKEKTQNKYELKCFSSIKLQMKGPIKNDSMIL